MLSAPIQNYYFKLVIFICIYILKGLHGVGQFSSSDDRQLDLVPGGRRSVPGRDHLRPGLHPADSQLGHVSRISSLLEEDREQHIDLFCARRRKAPLLHGTNSCLLQLGHIFYCTSFQTSPLTAFVKSIAQHQMGLIAMLFRNQGVKRKDIIRTGIRTWGCWVGNKNAMQLPLPLPGQLNVSFKRSFKRGQSCTNQNSCSSFFSICSLIVPRVGPVLNLSLCRTRPTSRSR